MPITMQPILYPISALSLDTLREVGNIGAGNAMTALATLIDGTVTMSVPTIGIVPISDFAQKAGGMESVTAGVYMPVTGEAPGHVAYLLPMAYACRLADLLLGRSVGSTTALAALECSVLTEVGNILASSYLTAIGELTGLRLLTSPPALAVDMTAAILSTIACAFEPLAEYALTIVTHLEQKFGNAEGVFIYILEPGSLSVLLRALQMEG